MAKREERRYSKTAMLGVKPSQGWLTRPLYMVHRPCVHFISYILTPRVLLSFLYVPSKYISREDSKGGVIWGSEG